jgi:hypothetical protein
MLRMRTFALSGTSPGGPFTEIPGGARVTPVGDIEIEIVFRIAVRGRTSDLAQLLQAMNNAALVVISIVEKPKGAEEQCQIGVTTTVGGFSE